MATLYGDASAVRSVQASRSDPAAGQKAPSYAPGAVLALVTWMQRDDPHRFGARIPAVPQSVEFMQVTAAGQANRYRHFAGPELAEDHPAPSAVAQRTGLMLGLVPARLP